MAASGRPTISDVATAAGVSKGAVSFALNGRDGVSAETRERILEAAKSLGWRPSARARALSTSRAMAVGLVIARPPETLSADPFFSVFIAGVETVLSTRGQSLVLQVVPPTLREADAYRRLADEGRVDGVFLTDLIVDDPRPALLRELGLPAVR
ncbi:MAG: LacI family DNA-binding transcriptional regulator, partial [Humibacillus sp.]